MNSPAPESTIDIVRRKFAEQGLNATDVAKRAGIKGDQGRRILNRNGGTSEDTAALLLKTITEMIPPEDAQPAETPNPVRQDACGDADGPGDVAGIESDEGQAAEIPQNIAPDFSERHRGAPSAGRFRRGMAPAPFPEMELGSKVSPQDHDISPFDVFEKIENETVLEENLKRRAEERAASEREVDLGISARTDGQDPIAPDVAASEPFDPIPAVSEHTHEKAPDLDMR